MNQAGIEEFMVALGEAKGKVENGWVQCSCPVAFARHKHGHDSNPSFGINVVDDGKSGYNCFACGLKGRDLGDLLVELAHYAKLHEYKGFDLAKARAIVDQEDDIGYMPHEWEDDSGTKVFEPWPEWYLDAFKPAWSDSGCRKYLLSRGVVQTTAKLLDLRYSEKRDMVCFPIRNRDGFLSGLRGRSLSGKKYHDFVWNGVNNTSVTLYGESWLDPLKPVVVVEGPFDLAAVRPHYKNVSAIFMASINKRKMATLQCAVSMLAMTDDDMAGEQVFWHMRDVNPSTQRIELPKLFNTKGEQVKNDPGQMTVQQIRDALSPYVKLEAV